MDHVLLNESVAGANTTRTDSVTIELRNSTPPYMVAASQKVILNTNGTCVGNFSVNGNYFIVVKHRNMIDTWSANPVNIGAIPATYDFSTASAKAFGNNMIQVSNNIWACYSGDINRDENADLIDMSALEVDIEQFQFGYFNTDLNGDGNVDLLDSPILENNISNFVYSTHP